MKNFSVSKLEKMTIDQLVVLARQKNSRKYPLKQALIENLAVVLGLKNPGWRQETNIIHGNVMNIGGNFTLGDGHISEE